MTGFKCPHCGEKISVPLCYRKMMGLVLETLEASKWCQAEASRRLGVSYKGIKAWVRRYEQLGIHIPRPGDRRLQLEKWVSEVLGK